MGADIFRAMWTIDSAMEIVLNIIDLAGSDQFDSTRYDLIDSADGLIFLFADRSSFLSIESRWLFETKSVLNNASTVIVCRIAGPGSNFSDKQGESWSSSRGFKYCVASESDPTPLVNLIKSSFETASFNKK